MADINTTVAQLVIENPSRARFFEKLGIDYCCGGKRSLDEACAEQGLDARTMLAALLAEETAQAESVHGAHAELTEVSPDELIQNIIDTHHAYLRRELPRLEELGNHVREEHGDRELRLRAVTEVLRSLRADFEAHLQTEEEELFPALRRAASPEDIEDAGFRSSKLELIETLEEEHEATGMLLQEIRTLTDGFSVPDWGCNSFRAFYDGLRDLEEDIHRHVHKENNILFPAVFGR